MKKTQAYAIIIAIVFSVVILFAASVLYGLNFGDAGSDVSDGRSNVYGGADAPSFEMSRSIMGSIITISAASDSSYVNLGAVVGDAFSDFSRIDALMSTYKNDSEVSRLNRDGVLVRPDPNTRLVIENAIVYSKLSNGSFDITIKPVLDLWKEKVAAGTYPTDDELNATLRLVNFSNVTVAADSISFKQEGMAITLDALAKGYGADRAVDALIAGGVDHGFVNAGGDGVYFGGKSDGTPWNVALRNPDAKDDYITIISIYDGAVATSGNYERYFSEEAKVSHISDPRTGKSSEKLISATVIVPYTTSMMMPAMTADALATAVFVMGVEGLDMIEMINGVEALVITNEREIIRTSGFAGYEVVEE